jgi:hypothetical protein
LFDGLSLEGDKKFTAESDDDASNHHTLCNDSEESSHKVQFTSLRSTLEDWGLSLQNLDDI